MGGKYFLIFLLLFSLTFVSAAPPTDTIQINFDNGYHIIHSPQQVLKQNQDFIINYFVRNASNGILIDNKTTYCAFYLANNKGEVLYFKNSTYNIVGRYWATNLTGGNFSNVGEYDWGIGCNEYVNKNQGGAVIGFFEVTPLGSSQSTSQGIGSAIYLILMISLMFIFGFLGFRFFKTENLWVLGIFFNFLALIFLVYNVWLGYSYHQLLTGLPSSNVPEFFFYGFLLIIVVGSLTCIALLIAQWRKVFRYIKKEIKRKEPSDKDLEDWDVDEWQGNDWKLRK